MLARTWLSIKMGEVTNGMLPSIYGTLGWGWGVVKPYLSSLTPPTPSFTFSPDYIPHLWFGSQACKPGPPSSQTLIFLGTSLLPREHLLLFSSSFVSLQKSSFVCAFAHLVHCSGRQESACNHVRTSAGACLCYPSAWPHGGSTNKAC